MNMREATSEPAWRDLMTRLLLGGPAPLAPSITQHYRRVCDAYGTPPRAYHNLSHVAECLALYQEVRGLAENPGDVEFAIWLHDCVYDARRVDNEARSADIALEIAESLGLPHSVRQRVGRLILATRHREPPADRDEAVLVDIDLAILGAPPARYDRYSVAIRAEYAHVDDAIYRHGRTAFLRSLLDRRAIYHTPVLSDRFDKSARENLRREIRVLEGHE